MQGLLIFLGLIVLTLLLPVILPVVAMMDWLYRGRKARDAERFACARCGHLLGREGLERGDAAWAEHCAELHRRYPYSKLRLVRQVHAVCPRCETRYGYDEAERTFRPVPVPGL